MKMSHCLLALVAVGLLVGLTSTAAAGPWRRNRTDHQPTPQKQAPYKPLASPYVTRAGKPRYYVPPTLPGTPTWKMYGTEPGVVPGDWPRYAPFGFGGYRFPAVGNAAYR